MKVSVLVPVYRESKRVGDIIGKILGNSYPDKEMIVAVDGYTNPRIESALEPWRDRITVVYNNAQLGKAATLNRIALSRKTDVFLMLDNDIELPDDPLYLDKLAAQMEIHDILEIPKEAVRKSIVSRMMAMEFLSLAMTAKTMANCAGESPSMNGAAFAVRSDLFRELDGFSAVMNEDMDFAARAYRLNVSFGYPQELKVRNDVPDTVPGWLVQRKRWAMNNILWFRAHYSIILKSFFTKPAFLLCGLILMIPFISYVAVYFLAEETNVSLLVPLIFLISQHFHALAGLLFPSHLALVAVDGWIATVAGACVSAALYFAFSRILKFHFNFFDFFCYYFIYSPIWLVSNIAMLFVMLLKIDVEFEWKVARE